MILGLEFSEWKEIATGGALFLMWVLGSLTTLLWLRWAVRG